MTPRESLTPPMYQAIDQGTGGYTQDYGSVESAQNSMGSQLFPAKRGIRGIAFHG